MRIRNFRWRWWWWWYIIRYSRNVAVLCWFFSSSCIFLKDVAYSNVVSLWPWCHRHTVHMLRIHHESLIHRRRITPVPRSIARYLPTNGRRRTGFPPPVFLFFPRPSAAEIEPKQQHAKLPSATLFVVLPKFFFIWSMNSLSLLFVQHYRGYNLAALKTKQKFTKENTFTNCDNLKEEINEPKRRNTFYNSTRFFFFFFFSILFFQFKK